MGMVPGSRDHFIRVNVGRLEATGSVPSLCHTPRLTSLYTVLTSVFVPRTHPGFHTGLSLPLFWH